MAQSKEKLRALADQAEKQYKLTTVTFVPLKVEIDANNESDFLAKQLIRYIDLSTEHFHEWQTLANALAKTYHETNHWNVVTTAQNEFLDRQRYIYRHLEKCDKREISDKEKVIEPAKNAVIFKPRTLLHDATFSEYTQWKTRFRAYYMQNKMEDQIASIHKAFLFTCIDDTLSEIIDLQNPNSTAFIYEEGTTDDSYMNLLDNYFDQQHPLHIRLNKLITLEPSTNQQSSAFFQEFIKLSNDAKATDLNTNQILVSIMTAKCPNKELRTELLRQEREMQQVLKLAKDFDAAQRTQIVQTSATSSNSTPKCFRCSTGKHDPKSCWTHKNPCPNCNKTGHTKKNCRVKKSSSNAVQDSGNESTPTVLL